MNLICLLFVLFMSNGSALRVISFSLYGIESRHYAFN